MNRLNLLLMNLIGFLGFFGPPLFLVLAWYKRSTDERQPGSRDRRILGDVALAGATLEFCGFWIVFLITSMISTRNEWGGVKFWLRCAPFFSYSCILFVLIAILGKGKGRIFTILCCASVFCGLIMVDAMR
jgi:hypothetical protein